MLPTDEAAAGAGTGVLGNFETKLIRISDVSTIAIRHSKKLFTARGIIEKLREGVLLSPKLLNFGTHYQIN